MVRKPPSRVRYEEQHPVISFRVDREFFTELRALRYESGKSYADFMKIAAGIMKPDIDEAWNNGYEEAKADYSVTFPCAVCGEEVVVVFDEAKKFCRQALIDADWGHAACHENSR
ncbi:hypothetical protein ES703_54534 [subsurface metagenome]